MEISKSHNIDFMCTFYIASNSNWFSDIIIYTITYKLHCNTGGTMVEKRSQKNDKLKFEIYYYSLEIINKFLL